MNALMCFPTRVQWYNTQKLKLFDREKGPHVRVFVSTFVFVKLILVKLYYFMKQNITKSQVKLL